MLRRFLLALSLAAVVPIVACKGNETVVGSPGAGGDLLTLASMKPRITKSLTVTSSELVFGSPDARTTSPPIILTYNVDNGGKVSLGFPDMVQVISFAKLTDKNGVQTDLPILDQ